MTVQWSETLSHMHKCCLLSVCLQTMLLSFTVFLLQSQAWFLQSDMSLPCGIWFLTMGTNSTLSFIQCYALYWKLRKKTQVNNNTCILKCRIKYDFLKSLKVQSLLQHFANVFNTHPAPGLLPMVEDNQIQSAFLFAERKGLASLPAVIIQEPISPRFKVSQLFTLHTMQYYVLNTNLLLGRRLTLDPRVIVRR